MKRQEKKLMLTSTVSPANDRHRVSESDIDRYFPHKLSTQIERSYYARVNEQARLDVLAYNDEFLSAPMNHVALFSDHGVVHVRDVASNILNVLRTINGVLIPQRDEPDMIFMQGYGVLLAYNHDIGMIDFSAFGRAMHPEFAAQAVFAPTYDPILQAIWEENWGNLAWRLINLSSNGVLGTDPRRVLRELLSVSIGHSKSKVPIDVLNDPARLRQVIQRSVRTDLRLLYHQQQVAKAEIALRHAQQTEAAQSKLAHAKAELDAIKTSGHPQENEDVLAFYDDFEADSFIWLTAEHPALRRLAADVVDTVRALRVADALRQRGTTLKTSGGYPIFIDQNSANAVIALQKGSGEVLLLESDNPLSIGEANMASSELTPQGDLRLSFHRGAYASESATCRAAYACAQVVEDIQRDTLESFVRAEENPDIKRSSEIRILIEETDDNLAFADLILSMWQTINPDSVRRTTIVPSLKLVSDAERWRYLEAQQVTLTLEQRQTVLERMQAAGHKIERINPTAAFADVRETELKAGEILIEAGAPPGFVYVPMGAGLLSHPEGGYTAQSVPPWIPLGNTRVIRGNIQEATIIAERDIRLLMLPKEIYLKHWHDTYTTAEFSAAISHLYAEEAEQTMAYVISILKQIAMLDSQLTSSEVSFIQKFITSLGQSIDDEHLQQQLLTGAKPNLVHLRHQAIEYLNLQPPFLQVARLRDLATLLVETDGDVAQEEQLFVGELNGLLGAYLDEKAETIYEVYIVPQSTQQDAALTALLPAAERQERSYGSAYPCGIFYSLDYAEMIRERYRQMGFYAVVEKLDQSEVVPTK